MSYIILPNRWTRQPQGVVRPNPDVRGLSFLALPGQTLPDLVSGRLPVPQGFITRTIGRHGQSVVRLPAAGEGMTYPGAVPIADSAPYSIFVIANPSSESLRSCWFFVGNENGSPFPQINFGPNMNDSGGGSAGSVALFEYDGGYLCRGYATDVVDGNFHVWSVVRPAGAVAPRLYRDGKLLTLASSGTSASVPAVSTTTPYVHGTNASSPGRGPSGSTVAVAVCRTEATYIPATPEDFFAYFFAPLPRRIWVGSGVTLEPRYGRPISDISAGAWTPSSGGDLYAMLDEVSPADADYIVTSTASTCEVRLTALADPATSTGHTVRVRVPAGFSPGGSLTVYLVQGTTVLDTWAIGTPSADTTYSRNLSGAVIDSITDYTDLRLRFTAAS